MLSLCVEDYFLKGLEISWWRMCRAVPGRGIYLGGCWSVDGQGTIHRHAPGAGRLLASLPPTLGRTIVSTVATRDQPRLTGASGNTAELSATGAACPGCGGRVIELSSWSWSRQPAGQGETASWRVRVCRGWSGVEPLSAALLTTVKIQSQCVRRWAAAPRPAPPHRRARTRRPGPAPAPHQPPTNIIKMHSGQPTINNYTCFMSKFLNTPQTSWMLLHKC